MGAASGDEGAAGAAAPAEVVAVSAEERARAIAANQVGEFMRKKKLSLDDLINVGGAELKSSDPRLKERALRVLRCWELMARLGVKYVDIEHFKQSPRAIPASRARIRRGEHQF